MSNYIRFDWAMKRLLRNKANFAVLEGFLTTLLRDRIKIQKLLESESNQEERRQNAIRMKAKGFPAQDIADITGLSPEEIDRL